MGLLTLLNVKYMNEENEFNFIQEDEGTEAIFNLYGEEETETQEEPPSHEQPSNEEGEEQQEQQEHIEDTPIIEDGGKEYTDLALTLLGKEYSIIQKDSDGNDQEILLTDANLSKEDTIELIQEYLNNEKTEFKNNSLDVKGVDETTLSIIKAVKESNGDLGVVQELLETYNQFSQPSKTLDLEVEEDQIQMLVLHGRAKGLSEEEIEDQIALGKYKGDLQDRAIKAGEEVEGLIKVKAEQKANEFKAREEAYAKEFDKFKNDLEKDFTETHYKFDKKVAKNLANFGGKLKTIEGGQKLTDMDIAFVNAKHNPEMRHKLALLLYNNGELFDKYYSSKIKNEVEIQNHKKLRLTKTLGKSNTSRNLDNTEKWIEL